MEPESAVRSKIKLAEGDKGSYTKEIAAPINIELSIPRGVSVNLTIEVENNDL